MGKQTNIGKKVFEIWQSKKNGKWYWHLKNEFGEVYAHHGGLDSRKTAVQGCQSVQFNASVAVIKYL